jgi:hypothetical protein
MNVRVNSFGTVSIVLGVVVLFLFCLPIISVFLAAIGLVFGVLSYAEAKKQNESTSKGITGIMLNVLALLLSISVNVYYFENRKDFLDGFDNSYDEYWDDNWDDSLDNYDENNYYDDDMDTNFSDVDSLMLDENQLNDLNNTIDDPDNGPGTPPE